MLREKKSLEEEKEKRKEALKEARRKDAIQL